MVPRIDMGTGNGSQHSRSKMKFGSCGMSKGGRRWVMSASGEEILGSRVTKVFYEEFGCKVTRNYIISSLERIMIAHNEVDSTGPLFLIFFL